MRALLAVIFTWSMLAMPAAARTTIVVLPPDYPESKELLAQRIAEGVSVLGAGDRVEFFSAAPFARIAEINGPDPKHSRAVNRRKLAEQFAPVLKHIAGLPANVHPASNLMIPQLLDEIGRNVISSVPEKHADVLLVGSIFYYDPRDGRWNMTDRFYPSDGFLKLSRAESPFGSAGGQTLQGATIHYCVVSGQGYFVTTEHEQHVKRWWSIWTTEQGGRVGTISLDLATCARRAFAGEASGQTAYKPMRDAKAEMLRARAPMPSALPATQERPGEWFLRDDVVLASRPPTTTTGIAWVGIKWSAPVDVDLYARPDGASQWLYYNNVRSEAGYFNKDYLSATGERQFEYIEFIKPIDLAKTEVAINLYSGTVPAGPSGVLRIWFAGAVYEAPFKLEARSGNGGRMPIAGQHWVRVDLRKAVGLITDPPPGPRAARE